MKLLDGLSIEMQDGDDSIKSLPAPAPIQVGFKDAVIDMSNTLLAGIWAPWVVKYDLDKGTADLSITDKDFGRHELCMQEVITEALLQVSINRGHPDSDEELTAALKVIRLVIFSGRASVSGGVEVRQVEANNPLAPHLS